MKQLILSFLCSLCMLAAAMAQKGINYHLSIPGGGRLLMNVDSAAKNIYYNFVFPNQPNTSFNYLPEVDSLSIQILFKQEENVQAYRYSILDDNKPIVVNKAIQKSELQTVHWPDEILNSISLGKFPIKGKAINVLVYNVENPIAVQKSVFYGKTIPKAKIRGFSKRFATEEGVGYTHILDPKEITDLKITDKDQEITLMKDVSDIDYLYYTLIKDKQTDHIIFESKVWEYGGILNDSSDRYIPYVKIDKSIFKKSGEYEISIQPLIDWKKCSDCDISAKEIDQYTTRHILSISMDNESFTKKELITFTSIVVLILIIAFLIIFYFNKRVNNRRLAKKEQQENIAKLQLQSIRSQLNPHFLFNALSGIQNLMNKNDVDSANSYLSKFARLTRNVLDHKDLISLSQEKKLLDDYLQMEQLRFGFTYEISHANELDLENIEIPSMLLQPFLENAVKHAVSQKFADGHISISFLLDGSTLLLRVSDNGNGYDTNQNNKGLGLPLSTQRIELLNSIYKENLITLTIQSNNNGTIIDIILKDWL